jgi:hypothetical protein
VRISVRNVDLIGGQLSRKLSSHLSFVDAFSNITDNNQARLQAKDTLGRWGLRVMNPDSSYGKPI